MAKAARRNGGRPRSVSKRPAARLARLRAFARLVADAFSRHALGTYAAAISFRALVALVPLVLLGLGLLGALGLRDVWTDAIAPAVKAQVTAPVFTAIDFSARRIFETGAAGLIAFAAALVLFDLTWAVTTIMAALNRVHDVDERRSFLHRHAVAAALALAIALCLIGSVLVVSVGSRLVSGSLDVVLSLARWPLALILLALAVALLVRYAPAERPRVRWASVGSLLIIATWVLASLVFRWWIGSVANFKTAVGTLAVFLVLTAYVFTSVTIFLIGVQVDELVREDREGDDTGVFSLLRGALAREGRS